MTEIKIGNREIAEIKIGNTDIVEVRIGNRTIWVKEDNLITSNITENIEEEKEI